MKERKATIQEIQKMKIDGMLELPWNCLEDNEFIYLFEMDGNAYAVIRLSSDPLDSNVIWIDEFEIIRDYRKRGIGKLIICGILKECNMVVKLLAKNKLVAKFWEKCGFQYDDATWAEISMIYSR